MYKMKKGLRIIKEQVDSQDENQDYCFVSIIRVVESGNAICFQKEIRIDIFNELMGIFDDFIKKYEV